MARVETSLDAGMFNYTWGIWGTIWRLHWWWKVHVRNARRNLVALYWRLNVWFGSSYKQRQSFKYGTLVEKWLHLHYQWVDHEGKPVTSYLDQAVGWINIVQQRMVPYVGYQRHADDSIQLVNRFSQVLHTTLGALLDSGLRQQMALVLWVDDGMDISIRLLWRGLLCVSCTEWWRKVCVEKIQLTCISQDFLTLQ